jgi:hypothetical protein
MLGSKSLAHKFVCMITQNHLVVQDINKTTDVTYDPELERAL